MFPKKLKLFILEILKKNNLPSGVLNKEENGQLIVENIVEIGHLIFLGM